MPEYIQKLNSLQEILVKCYSKDTAYPLNIELWNSKNPTCGQCAITAVIIQDYFGGTIHRIKMKDNETHYFNILDGKIVDFTKEQYELYNIVIQYEPNELISRERILSNPNTNKRYNILKERVEKYNI